MLDVFVFEEGDAFTWETWEVYAGTCARCGRRFTYRVIQL